MGKMLDMNRFENKADGFKPPMNCPKCGFLQTEGPLCLRCGLVFAHYHVAENTQRHKPEQVNTPANPGSGQLRRFYRILSWISLAGLIAVVVLILHVSDPPQIVVTPDASQHAEAKIQAFQSQTRRGMGKILTLDESELNGWIGENLMLKGSHGSLGASSNGNLPVSTAKKAIGTSALDSMSPDQIQSSVRDVKIKLLDDNSLRVYGIIDAHGVDLSLELEGRLLVRDGYMRLEPTSGKLGSLPLTSGMLQNVTDRIFDSPENKEKFRLPPEIRDIQIKNARLVVASR